MDSNNNFIFYALYLFIICTYLSCSGKDSVNQDNSKIQNTSDSSQNQKYLKMDDSKVILDSWSKNNVVIFHHIGDPDGLHPTNDNSFMRKFIFQFTQKTLVATDLYTLELRPDAVRSLPEISPDQMSYTYQLKDKLIWDDGSAVTVEDVLFSIKIQKCPLTNNPQMKPYVESVKDVILDKNDSYKFTIVMKNTYIQNIHLLTDIFLMQRKYFDPKNNLSRYTFSQFDDPKLDTSKDKELNDWATEFNSAKFGRVPQNLAGLGQYKVENWEPGQTLTLVKKQNHWTSKSKSSYDAAYPDKIIFKENKDNNSQMLEFKTQAMDASVFLSIKTLSQLQQENEFNANYHSKFGDSYSYSYICMNCRPDGLSQKKFFIDKNVRRAIALLVPIEDLITVIRMGKGKRIIGPVSLLKPEYHTGLSPIAYDIEKAKKLLDSAGWIDSDGDNIRDKIIDGEKVQFLFKLSYMTSQVEWKDNALMMAESFYKAGIKAELHPQDFAVHVENAKNHNFDMMLGAWVNSSAPDDFTQLWHSSSWSSKGSNYSGFGNAESDALIDSIKFTLDDTKRIQMVKRFQELIYEEQPYVFTWASTRSMVIHKRFGNAEMFFERPHILLNNLRLLTGSSVNVNSANN